MLLLTTISKKSLFNNVVARTSLNQLKVVSLGGATRPLSVVVGLPSSSIDHHLSYINKQNQHQQQIRLSSVRFLSTTPPPPPSKNANETDESSESSSGGSMISNIMGQIITPRNQFYALAAGGTLGAYFISRGFLAFTSFFTHLHPAFVAKWAFYTGFGCATGKILYIECCRGFFLDVY